MGGIHGELCGSQELPVMASEKTTVTRINGLPICADSGGLWRWMFV